MRKLILILFVFLTYKSVAQNQKLLNVNDIKSISSNDCNNLLKEGLYEVYNFEKTDQFEKDFKSYLESEKFRSDFSKGGWSGGLSVSYNGNNLGLDGNENETEVKTFQEKLKTFESISLSEKFYVNTATRIPNVELANAYVDCINVTPYGFKVTADISETTGTIRIRFIKESGTKDPKVLSFMISGANAVNTSIKPNLTMRSSEYAIGFTRKPKEEINMVLETTRGTAVYRHPAQEDETISNLPIGTIIASYLPFDKFRESINEKGTWRTNNKWAPCDGRNIMGSKFADISTSATAPDLRGQFLRGLNSFDNNPNPTVPNLSNQNKDPESRTVGSKQSDAFQGHHHQLRGNMSTQDSPNRQPTIIAAGDTGDGAVPNYDRIDSFNYIRSPKSDNINGVPRISSETRPKNVAIYYYIKIN